MVPGHGLSCSALFSIETSIWYHGGLWWPLNSEKCCLDLRCRGQRAIGVFLC